MLPLWGNITGLQSWEDFTVSCYTDEDVTKHLIPGNMNCHLIRYTLPGVKIPGRTSALLTGDGRVPWWPLGTFTRQKLGWIRTCLCIRTWVSVFVSSTPQFSWNVLLKVVTPVYLPVLRPCCYSPGFFLSLFLPALTPLETQLSGIWDMVSSPYPIKHDWVIESKQ